MPWRRRAAPPAWALMSILLVALCFTLVLFSFTVCDCFSPAMTASPVGPSLLFPHEEGQGVFAIVLTGDAYCMGAEVLAQSLLDVNSTHGRVALVTPAVSADARERLGVMGYNVREVDPISNPSTHVGEARWMDTYTKLRVWEMTDFFKVVVLDSDMLALRNVDDLFLWPQLSASPDCCDYFNSGVMVIQPSRETFHDMMSKLSTLHSYDGGDQGFLNKYFIQWNRLPYAYNAIQTDWITNHAVWNLTTIRLIHYVKHKPWAPPSSSSSSSSSSSHLDDLLPIHKFWWQTYRHLPPALQTLSASTAF